MSRKILWHTVAQNKVGGYLFKGDDPLYYGDDPIYWAASIEGPSVLQHGVVGTYTVSGEWEPELVAYDADGVTIGSTTSTGFTLTLDDDSEAASVKAYYQGLLVDTVYIQCAPILGEVIGGAYLVAGESGYYAHNLGASATYTGTLEVVSSDSDGAVLMAPEDADPGDTFFASWSGLCGATASRTVTCKPCAYSFAMLDPYDVDTFPLVGDYIVWNPAIPTYARIESITGPTDDCTTLVDGWTIGTWDPYPQGWIACSGPGPVGGCPEPTIWRPAKIWTVTCSKATINPCV